jgi:hypothetical protein
MRLAIDSAGQDRQVWRDKGYGLGGEAAEWALIAAMAGRRVPGWNFVVVDLDAELGGVAKERLELGGDRRVIGAGESGRGDRRRRRGAPKYPSNALFGSRTDAGTQFGAIPVKGVASIGEGSFDHCMF